MDHHNGLVQVWESYPIYLRSQWGGIRPDSFMLLEDDLFLTLGQMLLGLPLSEQNRSSPNFVIASDMDNILRDSLGRGISLTNNLELLLRDIPSHPVFNGIPPVIRRYNGNIMLCTYISTITG